MRTWRVFEAMAARDFENRLRATIAVYFFTGLAIGLALGAWLL